MKHSDRVIIGVMIYVPFVIVCGLLLSNNSSENLNDSVVAVSTLVAGLTGVATVIVGYLAIQRLNPKTELLRRKINHHIELRSTLDEFRFLFLVRADPDRFNIIFIHSAGELNQIRRDDLALWIPTAVFTDDRYRNLLVQVNSYLTHPEIKTQFRQLFPFRNFGGVSVQDHYVGSTNDPDNPPRHGLQEMISMGRVELSTSLNENPEGLEWMSYSVKVQNDRISTFGDFIRGYNAVIESIDEKLNSVRGFEN